MTDTTDKPTPGGAPSSSQDGAERLLSWARNNTRTLTLAITVLVVVAAGVWFVREYRARTAVAAQSALDQARMSVQSENYPLAASDLTRLIDSSVGTPAAEEGIVLLARVRLLQAQPEIAVQELRAALARGMSDEFRAAAYAVLGIALEDADNPGEAATAYREASRSAPYEFLATQYLLDAARASLSAGDTTAAIQAYDEVLREYPDAPNSIEANSTRMGTSAVRIGHLAASA